MFCSGAAAARGDAHLIAADVEEAGAGAAAVGEGGMGPSEAATEGDARVRPSAYALSQCRSRACLWSRGQK